MTPDRGRSSVAAPAQPVSTHRQAHEESLVADRKPGKRFEGELSEYKAKYLRCRGRRNHPWKVKTDFNITTKQYRGETRVTEFQQILHCAICTTDRIDTYEVTPEGRFVRKGHPRYEYADGYQLHRGNVKWSLEEARDELLMRELGGSLNTELFNRLISMRPEYRSQPRLRVVGGSE